MRLYRVTPELKISGAGSFMQARIAKVRRESIKEALIRFRDARCARCG
jgi:hypothetical protein